MKTRIFLSGLVLLSFISFTTNASSLKERKSKMNVSVQECTDPDLNLENWMVNECYWKCMKFNSLVRDYDEAPVLESWMTDLTSWEFAPYMLVEGEAPLKLEEWMTEVAARHVDLFIPVEKEVPLLLETWMTDSRVWSVVPGIVAFGQ